MPGHQSRRRPQPLTNGNVPDLAGAPWYIKLVVWMLAWFGVPLAGLVIALLMFTGAIPSPLTDVLTEVRNHRGIESTLLLYIEANGRVTRQICRNTAREAAERVACDFGVTK